MFYKNELSFLCDVFTKSHVDATVLLKHELIEYLNTYQNDAMSDPRFAEGGSIYSLVCELRHQTLYKLTDSFYRRFMCMLLPLAEVPTALVIGPYLSSPMSSQSLLALGEEMNISPQKQKYLNEYYHSIPHLPSDSPLMTMLNSFCELIWKSPSFAIEEVVREHAPVPVSVHKSDFSHSPNDAIVNIKALERRYAFENELIRSVSLGQIHMEDRFVAAFSGDVFEKRASDPLRNAKNYSIIMNTLLRKAAEEGGVHPVYLDQVSSDFAHKIENLPSLSENTALMREMFRTYCRLVRRYTVNKYSPVVKKAVLTIDSDLSADLSAGTLAASQGISLGYLSTVFKREVGKTLSAYVRERRMDHAKYLLSFTNLQIQTVALHCGVLDVQYFTKIFKSQLGMTPSEYRAAQKSGHQE